jgi:serine/threonine-protein kinase
MSDTSNDLEKGHQFGSYEIVRLLGKGAFGAVYEALRQPLKKRTALKVLHSEFVRHQEVVARFLQEAETVAQLDHPHIVGVFDVGVHAGVPFIAMEFLDGEPLANRIEREGKLTATTAIDLMLAVFSAVSTVHEKGIIHRDLKPDNIFLARPATGGVQPKLLDFGIAKVRDASKALTRTNAVLGTPFYMSPEQAEESKNISNAADQWSLSVILFEAITGNKAFDGDSLLSLLNSICFHPTPDPRTHDPSIPPVLASALMRAMSKKAADRFPSVRDFGRAILPGCAGALG